ncbi:MAG: ATP-binding protein [Nitrospinota bacterium]|jgi:two-component system nitrogen regulation sensor histidine kinase NtrY|nr:ATP-binding protein [Nitrospinota bacterium]
MQKPHATFPSEEYLRRKKRRIIKIAISVFILLVLLTFIETFIMQQHTPSPLLNNVIVFALFNIIIILLCALVLLIFRNLVKLYSERRSGIIGAKFQTKLVLAFLTLALVPSALLFLVASKLFTYSIDNWFNVQVETSLKESLHVAQSYYKNHENNSIYFSEKLSEIVTEKNLLAEENLKTLFDFVRNKRIEYGVDAIKIFKKDIVVVEIFNPKLQETIQLNDFSELVNEGLKKNATSELRSFQQAYMIAGISPVLTPQDQSVQGVVLTAYYIPKSMISKINEIQRIFEEYKQQKLLKYPVKAGYITTFLMITLLILFSAIWFGFYLARGITDPIQELAEGTKAIAAGNLSIKIDVKANDEIGILVDSFNQMSDNLRQGKIKIEATTDNLKKINTELDKHGKYMETVLENIGAGVISFDRAGKITTVNKAAVNILKIPSKDLSEKYYKEIFKKALLKPVRSLIKKMNKKGLDSIEEQINVTVRGVTLTLLTSISVLRNRQNDYLGMVIVFEDLTELIRTQKIAAWREAARDFAHEIKNPLTPIQLNTQRIQKKFKEKSRDFNKVFKESTKIIVSEVNGMKELLNEFSQFARMPESRPKPYLLHDIIDETVNLYNGVKSNVEITKQFDPKIRLINIDYEQIKRVFVNIIDNAIDAMNGGGRIEIGTYLDEMHDTVKVKISDCGEGINTEDKVKLFIPYFTTKKRGTGLGLAIANRILKDHNGTIKAIPNKVKGTTFLIELPV